MTSMPFVIIRKALYPVGFVLSKLSNWIYSDENYYFLPNPSYPYSYVQRVVENEFEKYIRTKKKYSIFIVGAYKGEEVPALMSNRNVSIDLFEPVKEYVASLKSKFGKKPFITVHNVLVGDKLAQVPFYELSAPGNGSALKPSSIANLKVKESYLASQITLDSLQQKGELDLLWIDVQGYEMNVLHGAKSLLQKTQSVFIEVQHEKSRYKHGATFTEIDALLQSYGFKLVLIGLSHTNLEGNAYYVRR